jgi:hypothetical protein
MSSWWLHHIASLALFESLVDAKGLRVVDGVEVLVWGPRTCHHSTEIVVIDIPEEKGPCDARDGQRRCKRDEPVAALKR